MNRIEQLKELQMMLDQNLISKAEYDKLRSEALYNSPPPMPAIGNIGRPFSVPAEPSKGTYWFCNPQTGGTVMITKASAFWCTFLFGPIYLAFKEVWLHAAIAFALAFIAGPFVILFWFVYAFFAFRLVVDTYRRKGWIEVTNPHLVADDGDRRALSP